MREDRPRLPKAAETLTPGGTAGTGRREINMLRKTILALVALTAVGAAVLPATDASAYWCRGWHSWHRHYGWHHYGWRQHYGWYHHWG
jgi:hypothetical protein